MVMVSRNEIIGVALVGIALFSKLQNRNGDPFIISGSNFLRQAEAQTDSFEETESLLMVNPNKARIDALTAERTGIIQGLNAFITPFFRNIFAFDIMGNIKKISDKKFRVAGGGGSIFGTKTTRCNNGVCVTSPKAQAQRATFAFGKSRITAINLELDSL